MLSPLYGYSTWVDVNIYHVIGNGAMLHGKVLYHDLFDHKGPYIFFLYGFGSLFSSTSFIGIFFIEVLLFTVCLSFIYKISRLFLEEKFALISPLIFPVFYFLYSFWGGAAEDFVLISEIISIYFLLKYITNNNNIHPPKYMFVHGIMIGFTFLLKLNLILFWFFPLLFILIILINNKLYKNLISNILVLILGLIVSFLPVFVYLIYNNALSDFYESYIHFNLLYGNQISDSVIIRLKSNLRSFNFMDYIIFFLYLLGQWYVLKTILVKKPLGIIFLFLSFVVLLVSLTLSFYLFGYYLIILVVFSIFPLISLGYLLQRIKLNLKSRYFVTVLCVLSIVLCCAKTRFFDYSLSNIIERKFPNKEIDVFKNVLDKEDNPSLLCLGFDKTLSIYTISGIVPNVRFFFLPNIRIDVYPLIYNEQIKYIENKQTDYLVIDDYFRFYNQYIDAVKANYEPVAFYPNHVGSFVRLYKKK